VPAVQLFSGPNLDYHRSTDTADKIDADGLVKVASVAREAVEYLSAREGALTGASTSAGTGSPSKGTRKASLGVIPDFAYQGKGLRLSGIVPGSPAEAAGMKEGDIIVRVNSAPVAGLRDFSDILKSLKPGDKVSVTFVRDGKESTVQSRVTER
jgi:S1-C subfamily serine protease